MPFTQEAPLVMIPDLMNEEAFLARIGVNEEELKKIWWFRGRMYRQFEVSRGKRKPRIITAPDRRLKQIQREIGILLAGLYRVRRPVHGFVAGRSIKTNASEHLGKKFLVNIDLEDFFPSIDEGRVDGLLRSLGVDGRVSKIISRLCCLDKALPQGAPTSPILSNMICFKMDKDLMSFSRERSFIYTRYADDITFSSYRPMGGLFESVLPSVGKFVPEILSSELRAIISRNGFRVNPFKSHYSDRKSSKIVTGLKVNDFINVDRRFVRNIRAALYSVETLGVSGAQEKYRTKYSGRFKIEAFLKGKIEWLRHIRGQSDPVFRALAMRFNKSFPDSKIDVVPTFEEVRDRAVWIVEYCEGEGDDIKMGQGTAFFLKGVGLVTAAHCVEEVEKFDIFHATKPTNKFTAKVLRRDAHRDLALLEHDIPPAEFFELDKSVGLVAAGDEMTAVGYPSYGLGDRLNIRECKVSSTPRKHAVKYIEVTQNLSPGMSGGPVLNSDNMVAGIVHKGGAGEERNFAVDIEMLTEWLSE